VLLVGGTASLPKLSSTLESSFPSPTTVIPLSYNPSELLARGAAIQASLISSYDPETIAEAVHPVVTVVNHLTKPIGVKSHTGHLDIILEADTAVPCRGKREYLVPEGGDVFCQVFEGRRETEVVAGMPTPPPEGEDDEEETEPEKRRVVVPDRAIAVVKVRGVGKGGRVEVHVQIDSEGRVTIVGREIGRKDGAVAKCVIEPQKESSA
jgi:molecular chaperone DnaK (HSP70)